MSRRTVSTIERPPLHPYQEDRDTPGTCARCHLIKANDVHTTPDDPRLLEQRQAQDEHRRRIGEHA